ncbi:MAG TPA: hypothetical protein P5181_02750 [Dermatophilaceae bacterium]|nr:hypothetical protein [Dermatophilaceae bacterium]
MDHDASRSEGGSPAVVAEPAAEGRDDDRMAEREMVAGLVDAAGRHEGRLSPEQIDQALGL